jgi:hypothetical protein
MTRTIEQTKWSFRRHTKDFKKLCVVATAIKNYTNSSITNEDKNRLQQMLKDQGLYSERNPDMPLDSIDHKIRDLAFYMFGYRKKINGKKMFLFSPLGNLFLENIDSPERLQKIFFSMLWSMQYEHPESATENTIQLYPFRLILTLLQEPLLGEHLYSYEISYVLMFSRSMKNKNEYEEIIQQILRLRSLGEDDLINLFKADEHAFVNAIYEWDYYSSNILVSAGIISKDNGDVICRLHHGTSTIRKVFKNKLTFNSELKPLFKALSEEDSLFAEPLRLDSSDRLTDDVTKEIYSYYPAALLLELGLDTADNRKINVLLQLPALIEQYSNNNNGEEAYLFEDILEDGFNMFYNVDANKIGGAGNTDLECIFNQENLQNKKFAVDAKSTKNKLSAINAGRLAGHREKIGAEYSIVVTPRYVPAVKMDIRGTKNVILLASTFSEYLYNCIVQDKREIDYTHFDTIIEQNFGKDISNEISNLTFTQFASQNS